MSFPNIPSVTPDINLTIEEAVNLLLSSIAFEELGLAHIINAEAEKIQFILGTLPCNKASESPTTDEIIRVNEAVESLMKTVISSQTLLQFKLESVLSISTSSTTTTSTTTTTTTTTKPPCPPALTYAVFANKNFSVASKSKIDANTQVNGNLIVTHSGNIFLGNTKVVGTFTDNAEDNSFENLVVNAPHVQFKEFNATCLQNSADLIIMGDVNIASEADTVIFQDKTVWVNGSVSVTGSNISITGGGILATGNISICGGNFTYNSRKCFALYSQTGDIRINNGPYNIVGLIYTTSLGDIRLAAHQGGTVCGAIISGRDVMFTGVCAIHKITNTGSYNPCQFCKDLCPE